MKTEKLEVSITLPVEPAEIYKAWLSSKAHSAFTGGTASISARKGSKYTAWDDYISGKILELEKDKRILHSWRAAEFRDTDPDSMVEILLEKKGKGTKLTIRHSGIPEKLGRIYKQGWKDYYFTPMKAYFGS
ncbi:MAG: Activator of Hsp90 ATPase 1 family protein [Bacteroidetes bacterium]|nr:MAG: Activator of Hsp90 ATPase 1 family protein [Bacteroidota bacterium]